MTEISKAPKAYAIALCKAWGNSFPIDVKQIAYEVSAPQLDPIAKINQLPIPVSNFEGALLRREGGKKWGIIYSGFIREKGKINFTIAHEFGHYLLHREHKVNRLCDDADLSNFPTSKDRSQKNIEQEANEFASFLLMPLNDFRLQVASNPLNVSLVIHCAERYGTSLTAAALKLLDCVDRPALAVLSASGKVRWAKSSIKALKLGLWLKSGTHIPEQSPSMRCVKEGKNANNANGIMTRHGLWFPTATIYESAIAQPNYGTVLSLLECKEYDAPDWDEEESATDLVDRLQAFS